MRRAVAIFIVAVMATVSVPYSHLFGIAVNGFAAPAQPAAPGGLAWAEEFDPIPCSWVEEHGETPVKCPAASDTTCCVAPEVCNTNSKCEVNTGSPPPNSNEKIWYFCTDDGFCATNLDECTETQKKSQKYDGPYTYNECQEKKSQAVRTIRQAQQASQQCNDACKGKTYAGGSSLGGLCSTTAPQAQQGIFYYPNPPPQGQQYCSAGNCYCAVVNVASFFQGVAASNQLTFSTVSVPGTGKLVNDSDEVVNPPRFPANQLDCALPTNATLKANLSQNVAAVGMLVSVNGEVGKLTQACKGVSYSCRRQYQQGCRLKQGFFKTCIVYNECNAGDKTIFQSGAKCEINWLAIIGIILIIAGVFAGVANIAWLQSLFSAAGPAAAGLQLLLQQKKQDLYFANACNSICGMSTGDTSVMAAPTCNGYPIAYKEGDYLCRLGLCGGFEQKDVDIEIKDSAGSVVQSDTTRTDDTGNFSYTFSAPGPAGTYLIVVSTEAPNVNITLQQNTTVNATR